jgi:hypothetical protein
VREPPAVEISEVRDEEGASSKRKVKLASADTLVFVRRDSSSWLVRRCEERERSEDVSDVRDSRGVEAAMVRVSVGGDEGDEEEPESVR